MTNILAITTRYFGGILLGAGGLVRAYSKSVRDSIVEDNLIELENGYEIEITISYDKQKVFEYLSKQASFGDIMPQLVSLYSRLASVLVLERETTQLEYKLLSVLLGEK